MAGKMDLKSGMVVPFHVTVKAHGTRDQVLSIENKLKD